MHFVYLLVRVCLSISGLYQNSINNYNVEMGLYRLIECSKGLCWISVNVRKRIALPGLPRELVHISRPRYFH